MSDRGSPGSALGALLSYKSLVHATAGAVGGVVAMAAFFPLDTLRSRLQLDDQIKSKNTAAMLQELVSKEGFGTLYRGMGPVLQSLCASSFVYFYTFHGLKASAGTSSPSAVRDLLFGTVAGVVNVLTTTPLWVVNTRLKMQGVQLAEQTNGEGKQANGDGPKKSGVNGLIRYRGLLDGVRYVCETEGVGGLWSGMFPSLLLVSNPAMQFMVYEALKRRLVLASGGDGGKDKQLGAHAYFLLGAAAKAFATLLTYPLQLVQAKLRHGHNFPGLPKDASIFQVFSYILKRQGVKGLFKGLEAKILQTVLTAALMFLCYEKIAAFIFRLMMAKKVAA